MKEETEAKEKPEWVKLKSSELESMVVELGREGKSAAEIGRILRDRHGVPKVRIFGRRVEKILKDKGIEYKDERKFIGRSVENLRRHIGENKFDHPASRALTKKLWVLHKNPEKS